MTIVVNALSIMKSTCQNEHVNKSETDYVQCTPLSDCPTTPSAARPFTASSRSGRALRGLASCDEQNVATLPLSSPSPRLSRHPIKWRAKDCLQRRGEGLGDGWPLALDRGRMRIEDTVLYMFATQLGENGEGAPTVAADADGDGMAA